MIEVEPGAITIASVEDGTFILVNPPASGFAATPREEFIGNSRRKASASIPIRKARSASVADLRRNEVVSSLEIRLRRKNGECGDILLSAALIDFRTGSSSCSRG